MFSESGDLLEVMFSVHQVKTSPFRDREGTQDRVIGDGVSFSKTRFAFANNTIHSHDVFENFRDNLFAGHAARTDGVGRFASGGEVAETGDDQTLPELAAAVRAGARLARSEATFQVLDRAGVGQVQVFEHFRRAPFAFGMTGKVIGGHAVNRACDCVMKPL